MKKSLVILISLSLIVLLSMSVVSASWFGDFWKKITGKTTENDTSGTGCADECSTSGNKQCLGDRTGYQTCGNYDSDSCLEWSSATSCSSSEICTAGVCVSNTYTCTDSDGGKDYNAKGNVVANSPTSSIDVTDLCSSSSVLVEYFCNPDKTQSGETHNCPNGCSNGACVSSISSNISTNQTTCTNGCSSNGATVCWGSSGYQTCGNYDSDSCLELNTAVTSCPSLQGCVNGACTTLSNQTGGTTTSVRPTATSTSTTTISSVSAGTSSGGRTTSTITESPEGIFEEKTITGERIEGEIKITTETKEFSDKLGNIVKVKINSKIKEDGTTITEEEREFLNKEGKLIKLRFRFENDGENVKIRREVEVEGKKFDSELEIKEEFEGNEVQLKAKLSDGSEQEIKIMPDRASEIAIEKLKSKNFNVELKEVGEGKNLQAVYIAKVDETGRFLGLFKVRLNSEVQIDSKTGEILSLEKQWWNFLTIKLNEPISFVGNQTNLTLPGNQTGNFSFNQTGNNTTNITNITLPPPILINQTNISFGNQTNLTNITLPTQINWSINYTCIDSDGGKNYNLTGTVIANSPIYNINVTDLCSSSSVLIEYFCNPDKAQSGETHNCPNGCSNGACL